MERLSRYGKFLVKEKDKETYRLIELVEANTNMALLQTQRIAEDNMAFHIPRDTPGPDPIAIFNLFADVHFFLISVDNTRKSIDKLNLHLSHTLKQVIQKYK